MKVKDLIELLLKCNSDKEVLYSCYSEGMCSEVEGVTETKEVVYIEENREHPYEE
jgi:hypothetical protein